jgi:2-octaprenyl-6-methoxyphenol hydroxylase
MIHTHNNHACDIAIIGGGFVGLTLAKALDPYGFKIALYDPGPAPIPTTAITNVAEALTQQPNPSLDNRGIALANSSIDILTRYHIWQELASHATPIKTIHISEAKRFGRVKLAATNYKLTQFGAVICGDLLLNTLKNLSKNLNNTTCHFGAKLDASALATIAAQQPKLIVGADGTNSILRTFANIHIQQAGTNTNTSDQTTNTSAIVCNIQVANPHQYIAYERFAPPFTLALVPFGAQLYKCILIAHNALTQKYLQSSTSEFSTLIANLIGNRCGKILQVGKLSTYPLNTVRATQLHQGNMVLLGNAANTIHPIAAQGLNLGLRDVATLTNILAAHNTTATLDAPSLLAEYSKLRITDHNRTAKFATNVVNLFDSSNPIIKLARGFGLTIGGCSSFIQDYLVAAGLGE